MEDLPDGDWFCSICVGGTKQDAELDAAPAEEPQVECVPEVLAEAVPPCIPVPGLVVSPTFHDAD